MQQRPRRPGHEYWFPAKRYGWGWGLPKTLQGWLVLDAYIVGMVLLASFCFLLNSNPGIKPTLFFIFGTIVLTAGLLYICYKEGEPPHWHWGR